VPRSSWAQNQQATKSTTPNASQIQLWIPNESKSAEMILPNRAKCCQPLILAIIRMDLAGFNLPDIV
jgi:hypothetical protein